MALIDLYYENWSANGPLTNGLPPHLTDENDWKSFYDAGYIVHLQSNPDSLYTNLGLFQEQVTIKNFNDPIDPSKENWLPIDVSHKIQGAIEQHPFWENLSEEAVRRIKEDGFKLIIWNGQEHTHHRHDENVNRYQWYLEDLKIALSAKEIPLQQVYLVSADLNMKADKEINFIGYNYFAYNYYSYIKPHYLDGNEEDGVYPETDQLDRKRNKHFLCLNGSPNDHRLYLVSELYRKGIQDKGHISLLDRNINGYPIKLHKYTHDLPQGKTKEIETHFEHFRKQLPILLDLDTEGLAKNDRALPKQFILDSYFSIINESFVDEEVCPFLFITEKCFKPIYYMHPFMVMGCKGTLAKFTEWGFETFDGMIDESYDALTTKRERLRHIVQETERLCNLPIEELHAKYQEQLPKLLRNRERLIQGEWVKRTATELVNEIAEKRLLA